MLRVRESQRHAGEDHLLVGEAEMTPRFQLGTVPYAGYAAFAGEVAFDDVTGVPAGLRDGDDVGPSYAAGEGVTLTGTTIAVDRASTQARVSGACAAGSAIRAIDADGTVNCEAFVSPAYTAGAGLTLTGTTFAADTSVLQARVGANCPVGQSIRAIASDGTVTCEVDDDTPTVFTAGTGLTLTGTTFAVDPSTTQTRVAAACASGSSIRAISVDGTVTCETDDDTDTNTTYTAGTGLVLVGTTFTVDSSLTQVRVSATCPPGSGIRAIAVDGTVTCTAAGTSFSRSQLYVRTFRGVARNDAIVRCDDINDIAISGGCEMGLSYAAFNGPVDAATLGVAAGWGCAGAYYNGTRTADPTATVVCLSVP